MRYEGSNPSLCTTFYRCCGGFEMDMTPSSNGRMIVALAVLAGLAVLVWRTMEPGKYQQLTWLLLGFFAFRTVLTRVGRGRVVSESSKADDEQ
jgi:hypothetical protein